VQVLLLLPELARPVMIRLLLHHLLILFLETGSLMTLLLYDVYLFLSFLFLGPCILAGHLVFSDIGCCIYDIGGLWIVFAVYGYVYMDLCLWLCVYGFVFMNLCLWLCVWISGLDPSRGPVQQILGLTSPWGPFSSLLGLNPS
jgi:hypothetical protein